MPLFLLHRLYNPSPKFLAVFSGCAARFVLDLVGNAEDKFSHDKPQIMVILLISQTQRKNQNSLLVKCQNDNFSNLLVKSQNDNLYF